MNSLEDKNTKARRPRKFKRLGDVLVYITQTLGKKLTQSTLWKHSAAGKLKKSSDVWTRKDVEEYASSLPEALVQTVPDDKGEVDDLQNLPRVKMKREIRKIEVQTEGMAFQNAVAQGKYFRKNDVWLELASRAAVLYQGLQQSLLAAVPDIVRAGRESPEKAEELMRGAVEAALDAAINQFSRPMTLDVETWDGTVEEEHGDSA